MKFLDKFFNNFQRKMVQYAYTWQVGRPVWSTQRDEQYLKEAYNKSVWVYACVAMIASCTSSVPWGLYRKRGGKMTEIDDHPILNMLNYKVNPYCTSKDFFDIWSTFLATQGKFYAELNNSALPTQMFWLYAHKAKPIPDAMQYVQGFEYRLGDKVTNYKAEQIMWSKFNDPLDAYQGLSPIRALARTIDTENEAVDWNKATLQNGAVPPGAIQVMNPAPELQEKLRDDWLKRYGGASNARVPLILNAEKASYVNFGLNPIDMDFLNQRKLNRLEICTAFGVPGQVVGDPEGQTYANYNEALKSFWENTIIPRYLDNIKDTLNNSIVSKYADNLYVEPNLDDIKALHESINEIADRVAKLFEKNIIKRKEAREAIGYDATPDDDVYMMDLTAKMFEQNTAITAQYNQETPDKQNDKEDDTEDDKKKEGKALNLSGEDQKMLYWKAFDNRREKYYATVERLCRDNFMAEKNDVIKSVKSAQTAKEAETIAIKQAKKYSKGKREILAATYLAVIDDFGKDTFKRLKQQKDNENFSVYDTEVQAYIANTTAKEVVNIEQTTIDSIKSITAKASEMGWGIPQLTDNIEKLYLDQIIPNRSTLIARTEVISASNYGSYAAAKQADADVKKIWIRTYDSRTRESHENAGSHPPIELDEYFIVNGKKMKYPGDFNGGASEVCNCRCTIGYELKD